MSPSSHSPKSAAAVDASCATPVEEYKVDAGVVSRSIVRHFNASLPERRRLLLSMWESFRVSPADRALRARLSRHLRVLAESAARAGCSSVESAARVVDRILPHAALNDQSSIEPILDGLLDAMAAISQMDAPAIAGRMPMVIFDGVENRVLVWLGEILVASGCQVEHCHDAPALPPLAAGHLVVLGSTAAQPTRVAAWRALACATRTPMRLALLGGSDDYDARRQWIDVDVVIAPDVEPHSMLACVEREIESLSDASPRVAMLGTDNEAEHWIGALRDQGFSVLSAHSAADVWALAHNDRLDAVLSGASFDCAATVELAQALAQDHASATIHVFRLAHTDQATEHLFAAGIEVLPVCLGQARAAAALHARLRRRPRTTQAQLDPLSGTVRKALFMLLMQGMLEGRAAFVGIGVIDLDGLREVMRIDGRAASERAAGVVAKRLRAALPATAVLGRSGSDEFLFGFTARNEAEARRMMAQVANPPHDDDRQPRVGHCIGGVLLDRDDRVQRMPLTELIARAGELMLDAKASNGSRIALARYGEHPIGDRWF